RASLPRDHLFVVALGREGPALHGGEDVFDAHVRRRGEIRPQRVQRFDHLRIDVRRRCLARVLLEPASESLCFLVLAHGGYTFRNALHARWRITSKFPMVTPIFSAQTSRSSSSRSRSRSASASR